MNCTSWSTWYGKGSGAGRADEWSDLLKSDELIPWTRMKLHECWVSMKHGKHSVTGGVQRAAASTIGAARTESWSHKTARTLQGDGF